MGTDEQKLLIKSAAGMVILENPQYSPDKALDKIEEILRDMKAEKVEALSRFQYLKPLIEAGIQPDLFAQIKNNGLTYQFIGRAAIYSKSIRRLKFSHEETLHILISNSEPELHLFEMLTERMRTFVSRVSQYMTKDKLTMQEGIKKVLTPGANFYVSGFDANVVAKLLSPQTIFELYLHAKAGLVLNVDNFEPKKFDEEALAVGARFHVAHQEKVYWNVDKGLTELGFNLREVNKFLIANANLTSITAFEPKVSAMIAVGKKIEATMRSTDVSKFNETKALVLNAQTGPVKLNEEDFKELLSPVFKSGLESGFSDLFSKGEIVYAPLFPRNDLQLQPAKLEQKFTPNLPMISRFGMQDSNLLANVSNSTIVMSVSGSLLLALGLVCYCKPRLLTGAVSLMSYTGNKLLGCLYQHPKKTDDLEANKIRPTGERYTYIINQNP
jgi:hypothetical protein